MPAIPKPKLELPQAPPTPQSLAQLQKPQVQMPQMPTLDQAKLVKPMAPFLNLGKGVANGSVKCT
jgi:hypothetical protein